MRKKNLFRRKKKTMFRGVVASVSEARNEGNSPKISYLWAVIAQNMRRLYAELEQASLSSEWNTWLKWVLVSAEKVEFSDAGAGPLWRRWRKTVRPCAGSRGKSAAAIPCRPNNPGKSPYFICWRRSVPTIRCSDTSLTPGSITAGRKSPGRVVLCPESCGWSTATANIRI